MTIQQFDIRESCFAWVDSIEDSIVEHDQFLNTIDHTLRDIALDVLYNINLSSSAQALKKLEYLENYTGSQDLFCPQSIMNVIRDLRLLIGI